MTNEQEKARELAKLLTAFADGKQLQYKAYNTDWQLCSTEYIMDELASDFLRSVYQFRIKSETKRIALTQQDLIDRELSRKTMMVKFDKTIMLITDFDDTYAWISGEKHEYGAFMFCYTFLDGTPCYKEVECE